MKSKLIIILYFFVASLFSQVAINTDGSSANESAILDIKSTSLGLLPPRMTDAQKIAIENPESGLIIYCTDCFEIQFYNGTEWVNIDGSVANRPVNATVFNPITSRIWLARDLGATRVAHSVNDELSFGDLYQWGRFNEGHEKRNSQDRNQLAGTYLPNTGSSLDGKFLTTTQHPLDWLETPNDNLWQGIDGINNPCPSGFRIPTKIEWEEEIATWTTQDAEGAYNSILRLTLGGGRAVNDGDLFQVGYSGRYWTSYIWGISFGFTEDEVSFSNDNRGSGRCVRCIKNE